MDRMIFEEMPPEFRTALGLPGDIQSEAWCREMVEKAAVGLNGLDILVINAGRQQFREAIDELSTEDFDRTMKTNLYALHWIAQAAIPHLPPGASVITTASMQA
jgi:NAD(P)-dependent dehydrogenase (short-subunit alcohol dehydrogenase family)